MRTAVLKHRKTTYDKYLIREDGKIMNRESGRLLRPFTYKGELAITAMHNNSKGRNNLLVKKCVLCTFDPEYNGSRKVIFKDGNSFNCSLDNLTYSKTDFSRITPQEWIEAQLNEKTSKKVDRRTITRWRDKHPALDAAIQGTLYVKAAEELDLSETDQAVVDVVAEQVMDHLTEYLECS